jgi:hypothetical protein
MAQNADEGEDGVGHPGTTPPEAKCRGVVTRKTRHGQQGKALSHHKQGTQGTLECVAGVWPRAVILEGCAQTAASRIFADIHRNLHDSSHSYIVVLWLMTPCSLLRGQ